jgi:hypothetical protein
MTKQKLVSFRCDERMYQALAEVAAQREMKVGELARELVGSCLTGQSQVAGRPWVKTVEVMLEELDMRLETAMDVAELHHDAVEKRFKFNEEMMTALLRGTVQSLMVMQHLMRRDDPPLLKQALADAQVSFKTMMAEARAKKEKLGLLATDSAFQAAGSDT